VSARRWLTLNQAIEALTAAAADGNIDPTTAVVAADRTQLLVREDDSTRAITLRAIELRPFSP
jgi:hypothetical protein